MKKLIIILLMLAGSAHAQPQGKFHEALCTAIYKEAVELDKDYEFNSTNLIRQVNRRDPDWTKYAGRTISIESSFSIAKQAYMYNQCNIDTWNKTTWARAGIGRTITNDNLELNEMMFPRWK